MPKKLVIQKKSVAEKLSEMSDNEKAAFYEKFYEINSNMFSSTLFAQRRIAVIISSLVIMFVSAATFPTESNAIDISGWPLLISFFFFIISFIQLLTIFHFWKKYPVFRKEVLK